MRATDYVLPEVKEVMAFADAAAKASGLPGGQFGPRDAFRHMVGAAELARRSGLLPAHAVTEGNEQLSWAFEELRTLEGRRLAPSLSRESRAMDRANNAIGLRIGLRVETPGDVIEAVKIEIERAHQTVPGANGAAVWFAPNRWEDPKIGDEGAANWPPRDWPNIMADQGVREYSGHSVASRYRFQAEPDGKGGGPVFVRPHRRDGHDVDGFTRAAPSR